MKSQSFISYFGTTISGLAIEDQDQVYLGYGSWNQIKPYCPYIKEWKISSLFLYDNNEPKIVRQIRHVSFPSLLELNVSGNRIETIEHMSGIYLPKLMNLYLSYNNILSISSTGKANWPNLDKLWINENNINKWDGLTNIIGNVRVWMLDYFGKVQCQDLCSLIKSSSKSIQFLNYSGDGRIEQRSTALIMKKKYKNITIVK